MGANMLRALSGGDDAGWLRATARNATGVSLGRAYLAAARW